MKNGKDIGICMSCKKWDFHSNGNGFCRSLKIKTEESFYCKNFERIDLKNLKN